MFGTVDSWLVWVRIATIDQRISFSLTRAAMLTYN